MPQLTLDQVVADARGIALCTLAEAQPYMTEVKNISADALSLLLSEEVPLEARGHHNIVSLRYPATSIPTNDPVLINGSLLQLGNLEVRRHAVDDPVDAMDIGPTHVLKVQLSKMPSVIQSPIRFLIQKAPLFRLCTSACGQFHAAVEDSMGQVLLEIWGRRFQTMEGRRVAADQADIFQAFLRIAAPALGAFLALVIEGIYLY